MPARAWVAIVAPLVTAVMIGVPAGLADWSVGAIYLAAASVIGGTLAICAWAGPQHPRE